MQAIIDDTTADEEDRAIAQEELDAELADKERIEEENRLAEEERAAK